MRNIARTVFFCMVIISISSSLAFAKPTVKGLFNVDFDVERWGGLQKGKNMVALDVTDAAGKAVEGAEIEITPWMVEMNHGTPFRSQVHDLGGGEYRANVPLTMGGSWEIRITVKAGDKTDTVTFVFNDVDE